MKQIKKVPHQPSSCSLRAACQPAAGAANDVRVAVDLGGHHRDGCCGQTADESPWEIPLHGDGGCQTIWKANQKEELH